MASGTLKLIGAVAAASAIAFGGYAAYDGWKRSQAPRDSIVFYGNIDIREADLAFNVSGRVARMLVEEGDAVKAGQALASLDPDIYQAELDAAQAKADAQRAALDRLLAGSRAEEIKEARANVHAIEADLALTQQNLQRSQKLAEQNFASRQKVDDDRARMRNLQARLDAAQQRLSLVIQGPRKEDIAVARAELKAGEAAVTLARRRLAYTKLHAPEDGVVKTRIAEPGNVALPQQPVYTLALVDPVWVRAYVSEPDLGFLQPGMTATISTDSAPDKAYEGWVGFVSPVAEFTPKTVQTSELRTSLVYRVRIFVKNPDGGLRQGMPVTARVKIAPTKAEDGQTGAE